MEKINNCQKTFVKDKSSQILLKRKNKSSSFKPVTGKPIEETQISLLQDVSDRTCFQLCEFRPNSNKKAEKLPQISSQTKEELKFTPTISMAQNCDSSSLRKMADRVGSSSECSDSRKNISKRNTTQKDEKLLVESYPNIGSNIVLDFFKTKAVLAKVKWVIIITLIIV